MRSALILLLFAFAYNQVSSAPVLEDFIKIATLDLEQLKKLSTDHPQLYEQLNGDARYIELMNEASLAQTRAHEAHPVVS
jgi:hypothetical protein